jgi:hypothetical protein
MSHATPQVVRIEGLPLCDSCVSSAHIVDLSTGVFIAYESIGDPSIALLFFPRVAAMLSHGPNDEAMHRHRFSGQGLQHYEIQEVLNSPWRAEVAAVNDKDGLCTKYAAKRHFVLALKEATVDILADDIVLRGLFPSVPAAMNSAISTL